MPTPILFGPKPEPCTGHLDPEPTRLSSILQVKDKRVFFGEGEVPVFAKFGTKKLLLPRGERFTGV